MSHPYQKYESLPIWEVVRKSVENLISNNDIEMFTDEEYVVGSIVKDLVEKKIIEIPPER